MPQGDNLRGDNSPDRNRERQFGQPNANPHWTETYAPHRGSIRTAQRHLATQLVDPTDPQAIHEMTGGRKLSMAEMMALKQMVRAMKDDYACKLVTDNIDGPQNKEPLDQKQPIVVNIIRFGAKNDDRISVIEGEKHEENRLIPREEQ
ncbi:MAG: hypothetical protein ACH344_08725 [Yersinia sp. (in: enterobacteria)]